MNIKSLVAVAAFTIALASCTSKPAETATESTTDSVETVAPAAADTTATAPADSVAAQ